MDRRQVQSDKPYWVASLSPAEKEELAKKDRPRSVGHE